MVPHIAWQECDLGVTGGDFHQIHAQNPAFSGEPMDQFVNLYPVQPTGCPVHYSWHNGGIQPIGIDAQVVWPSIWDSIKNGLHAHIVHFVGGNYVRSIAAGFIDFRLFQAA